MAQQNSRKDNMKAKYSYHPVRQGLYDFHNEHDSCGVGFVANTNGKKSHQIIEKGIRVLEKLMHRGAEPVNRRTVLRES